mmetsp:Transcript_6004/g.12443  ORF Transcript_6004/g.12443 Transcript_6004/m.12443 type:complete len:236 (-) Transcript_6004:3598-4305(-)
MRALSSSTCFSFSFSLLSISLTTLLTSLLASSTAFFMRSPSPSSSSFCLSRATSSSSLDFSQAALWIILASLFFPSSLDLALALSSFSSETARVWAFSSLSLSSISASFCFTSVLTRVVSSFLIFSILVSKATSTSCAFFFQETSSRSALSSPAATARSSTPAATSSNLSLELLACMCMEKLSLLRILMASPSSTTSLLFSLASLFAFASSARASSRSPSNFATSSWLSFTSSPA